MKQLLFAVMLFFSFNLFGQSQSEWVPAETKKLELLISNEQMELINQHTENCEKSQWRYLTKDWITCPVFIDEFGAFYITVKDNTIVFIDLDRNVPD